jgi:4-hydroxy-tetrahydrodipicolinate synthase
VQAIKLAMDAVGRYGGPTRLPRLPLPPGEEAQVRKDLEVALAGPVAQPELLDQRGTGV